MGLLELSADELALKKQILKDEFLQVFYTLGVGFGKHVLDVSNEVRAILEKNSATSDFYDLLERHFSCDFGEISDQGENLEALESHETILSSYEFFDHKIFIETQEGWNTTKVFTVSKS